MTSFGFHYFPDDSHYRTADLNAWLPELRALGAKWLTLIGSATRAIPEPFITALLNEGLTPIIHLPALPPRDSVPTLEPLFRTYAKWGVRYVACFSEPNTRAAWPPAEWGKTALVERFLDMLLPILRAQAEAGLLPVFPALKAGGEYWDTSFLEAALAGMERRGQMDLAQQLTFAVNLWTYNRPANWGAGGLQRWPEAKPYLTPTGSQDQRGFYQFDWLDEIIRTRLGQARPLLCLAGGPRLNDHTDETLPALDDLRHASCTQSILQAQLPEHLLNVNFWLLAAPEASPFASEAWYRSDGTTLAAVDGLKRWAATQHPERSEAKSKDARAHGKPINHYLLLPTFEWGISEWHWSAALDFVKAYQPTCGFSVEEAAQAENVTIVGNEQGIGREVETKLRQAGCVVKRVMLTPPAKTAPVRPVEERSYTWTPRSRL